MLEVLVSCMYQEDKIIVETSGISSNALVINQCDQDSIQVWNEETRQIRMISTTERGLSRSRNMAIKCARSEICLFCDNDEVFFPQYEQIINNAFKEIPDADIILFDFENLSCNMKKTPHRLHFFELLHAISCQIAFRRKSVLKADVWFNPYMGAGTGNGAQEENKFLMDCYKRGLKIYFIPEKIGRVIENHSTWFNGFDSDFFYKRGGATRQLLGLPLSVVYAFYYTITKRKMYCQELSCKEALFSTLRGCWNNPIRKQYEKANGV